MRTDVLIIGGGPAGLAAAIAARLQGFDVTVADAACPPVDKACGEGILPGGVAILRRLGVRLALDEAVPLRGIRFLQAGASAEARFPRECGMGLRRTLLHGVLTSRALELGVRLLWRTRFADVLKHCPCRWIVGADGQNSAVRHAAGLDAAKGESWRFGFRRHYQAAPWTDMVEVYWGPRCQVYVTPVSSAEIGIAVLSCDSHLRLDQALSAFPALLKKLGGAHPSSSERGAPTVSRRLCRVFRGRTVLVGDASGSVDAITGEGLTLSFHQAVALSDALRTGDLASYQQVHSRLLRRPALTAGVLLSMDRFPSLRRGIVRMLSYSPQMFQTFLSMGAPAMSTG